MKCLISDYEVNLIMYESDLTLQNSMNGVLIKNLEKHIKKKNIIASLSFLLIRCAQNFNVGKNLTDGQIMILAVDLFEIFKYETLEDVVLMLKYARQGKIGDGKVFNLDGQTILHKWVPAYLELKAIERERNHTENKGNKNGMANFNWLPEDVAKLELSNKIETIKEGFGTRMKEKIGTPSEYKSPIQDRKIYLKLLREGAKNATTSNLQINIQNLLNLNKEPDAMEIMQKELNKRNFTKKLIDHGKIIKTEKN